MKKVFSSKEEETGIYADFWNWFLKYQKAFHQVVKDRENIEVGFFNPLSDALANINDGIYYLTGMFNADTVELIFTPDGIIKNIVFVEELVDQGLNIPGWKFTALKPENGKKNRQIKMGDYVFNKENIKFYPSHNSDYPDEINLKIVYDQFVEEDKSMINNGIYHFLDHFLGELAFIIKVDYLSVVGKEEIKGELNSLDKLPAYLEWREKEFIEKYKATRYHTENDTYLTFEMNLKNGNFLVAMMNQDLLKWDKKASHPWMLSIEISYDGQETNGMPDKAVSDNMNKFENELISYLSDEKGYLNIGRETGDNSRRIFIACKEFRYSSKITDQLIKQYQSELDITYNISKDKYWRMLKIYISAI